MAGPMSGRQVSGPARAIAAATAAAVAAACARDAERFAAAAAQLDAVDPAQLQRVLGTVVRALLEDLHPDGVDGDDLHAVVQRCTSGARPWWPAVDPAVLELLLIGALGVQAEQDQPAASDVAVHAALLVADLLTARGATLDGYLQRAFRDIAYAENDGP